MTSCPKCGATNPDKDRLDEDCPLDCWMDEEGNFHWTCFECNNEWIQKRDEWKRGDKP